MQITITVEDDLVKWMKDEADKENRSFSNMAETLIKEAQQIRETMKNISYDPKAANINR